MGAKGEWSPPLRSGLQDLSWQEPEPAAHSWLLLPVCCVEALWNGGRRRGAVGGAQRTRGSAGMERKEGRTAELSESRKRPLSLSLSLTLLHARLCLLFLARLRHSLHSRPCSLGRRVRSVEGQGKRRSLMSKKRTTQKGKGRSVRRKRCGGRREENGPLCWALLLPAPIKSEN